MPDNVLGDYDRVGKIATKLQPEAIEPYTPHPTKREREFGEITRYFVRFVTHTSPSDILEVSKTNYIKLKRNPLYQTIEIRWKISGKLDDQCVDPTTHAPIECPDLTSPIKSIRLYTGVITANRLSVLLAEEELPGIKDYISGPLDVNGNFNPIPYKRFWEF